MVVPYLASNSRPPNRSRTIKWLLAAQQDSFTSAGHNPYWVHAGWSSIANFSQPNGLNVYSLILITNTASNALEECHNKSGHFQSVHGLQRLAHFTLVYEFVAGPILSPCIGLLRLKHLGSQSYFSGYSRASALWGSGPSLLLKWWSWLIFQPKTDSHDSAQQSRPSTVMRNAKPNDQKMHSNPQIVRHNTHSNVKRRACHAEPTYVSDWQISVAPSVNPRKFHLRDQLWLSFKHLNNEIYLVHFILSPWKQGSVSCQSSSSTISCTPNVKRRFRTKPCYCWDGLESISSSRRKTRSPYVRLHDFYACVNIDVTWSIQEIKGFPYHPGCEGKEEERVIVTPTNVSSWFEFE